MLESSGHMRLFFNCLKAFFLCSDCHTENLLQYLAVNRFSKKGMVSLPKQATFLKRSLSGFHVSSFLKMSYIPSSHSVPLLIGPQMLWLMSFKMLSCSRNSPSCQTVTWLYIKWRKRINSMGFFFLWWSSC